MHSKKTRKDTRNKNQRHDIKGEVQNVINDPSRENLAGAGKKISDGRSKAMEGIRQDRDRRDEGWNRTSERTDDYFYRD